MNPQALPQRLTILGLSAVGLLLALIVGWDIGSSHYTFLILLVGLVLVISLGLFSGDLFWVITIASSFLGGTFPILGGSFTPFQLLMVMGVGKFLIEDIIFRRKRIKLGRTFDRFLIAGFMGVLTLHAFHDRFGMRFLGSSVWGGRNYINVYVGLLAFFIIQSIHIDSKLWAKLPYFVIGVTAFDLVIALITTAFPSTIFKIYPFYSAVSTAGLQEIITGGPVETARVGAFGNIGFTLVILVLASVSLQRLFHPSNLLKLMVFLGGSVAVLFSSFRSAVLNTAIATIVAGIRDLRWAVLLLPPILALLLFTLSAVNADFFPLPKQMQRSLAFMPGTWDADMKGDATASNDFRRNVWDIWRKDYFPLHPWLGRGFGFRSDWAAENVTFKDDRYANVQMVEVGNIHNGFFAALDAFGIVGTLFFVLWNTRFLIQTFRVQLIGRDPGGTTLRFLALFLAVSIIGFWMGAQNVGSFLPREFAVASVFLRLFQDRRLVGGAHENTALEARSVVGEEFAVA